MTEEHENNDDNGEELSQAEQVSQILQRARLSKHAISRAEVLRALVDCDPVTLVDIVREYIAQRDPNLKNSPSNHLAISQTSTQMLAPVSCASLIP